MVQQRDLGKVRTENIINWKHFAVFAQHAGGGKRKKHDIRKIVHVQVGTTTLASFRGESKALLFYVALASSPWNNKMTKF